MLNRYVKSAEKESVEEAFVEFKRFPSWMWRNKDMVDFVTWLTESERLSHYFNARPASQFDAIIHFDTTRAVLPLDLTERWEKGEEAETYPFGL